MFANLDGQRIMDAYDACRRVFLLTSQLKPRCKYASEKFEKVSAWSVGNHIEHTLAVNAQTVLILSSDTTSVDPGTIQPAGEHALKILESGCLTRGAAQAPDAVLPMMNNYVDLMDDCERNTSLLDGLTVIYRQIAADTALHPHPTLGGLTKMQWLRFLEIHIQHHQKIIADIIGHNPGEPAQSGDIPANIARHIAPVAVPLSPRERADAGTPAAG